MKGEPLHLE